MFLCIISDAQSTILIDSSKHFNISEFESDFIKFIQTSQQTSIDIPFRCGKISRYNSNEIDLKPFSEFMDYRKEINIDGHYIFFPWYLECLKNSINQGDTLAINILHNITLKIFANISSFSCEDYTMLIQFIKDYLSCLPNYVSFKFYFYLATLDKLSPKGNSNSDLPCIPHAHIGKSYILQLILKFQNDEIISNEYKKIFNKRSYSQLYTKFIEDIESSRIQLEINPISKTKTEK